jgi:hypothetical protein
MIQFAQLKLKNKPEVYKIAEIDIEMIIDYQKAKIEKLKEENEKLLEELKN